MTRIHPIANLNAATDEHALRDALGLAPAKTVDLHHLGVKTNIHPNIDEVAPTNNPNTVSLDTLATAPVKTKGLADMGVKTNIHAPRDSTTSPSVHVDPLRQTLRSKLLEKMQLNCTKNLPLMCLMAMKLIHTVSFPVMI